MIFIQSFRKIIINRLIINFSLFLFFLINGTYLFAQKKKVIAQSFDFQKIPQKPDYSLIESWSALPWTKDKADTLPKNGVEWGLVDAQNKAAADVFYIYPTIYSQVEKEFTNWNADVFNASLNTQIDTRAVANQASIFNGSCKIYVPRYRQAHYSVFLTKDSSTAKAAMNVAYTDVKEAFLYYLKNHHRNRPFFIAAHSQGSLHAIRLIKEMIDGTELQKYMVAAYLVGMPVHETTFKNVKFSKSSSETGVFVSWNTFSNDYYPEYYKNGYNTADCTHPIYFDFRSEYNSFKDHKGLLDQKFKIKRNSISARVNKGILWIMTPKIKGARLLNIKTWHFADYNLFWLDVRENVALRLKTYLDNFSD
jgi:hypothetical protein